MRKNNFLRLLVTCVVSGLMAVNVMAERVSESDAAAVANSFMNPVSASSVKKAPAKRMALKKAAAEKKVSENTTPVSQRKPTFREMTQVPVRTVPCEVRRQI